MDASQLKDAYHIGPAELPSPTGTVVEIAGVDSEYYVGNQDGRQVDKVRHLLWFKGCRLPLRLNNTRVDLLMGMLGKETDAWVGRKIGLFVGAANHYGKTEPSVFIHVQAVDDLPVSEWPERYRQRGQLGGRAAAFGAIGQGNSAFGTGFSQRAHGAAPQLPTPAANAATFGKDRAAHILALLKQRGKSWDDLVSHLKRGGVEIAGTHPSEVLVVHETSIREFVRGFPAIADVDIEAEVSRLLVSWEPPAPSNTPAMTFDPATGEVLGRPPDDDIPF